MDEKKDEVEEIVILRKKRNLENLKLRRKERPRVRKKVSFP